MFNTMSANIWERTIGFKSEKIQKNLNNLQRIKESIQSHSKKNKFLSTNNNHNNVQIDNSKKFFKLITSDEEKIVLEVFYKDSDIVKNGALNKIKLMNLKRVRKSYSPNGNEERILDFDKFLDEFHNDNNKKKLIKSKISVNSNLTNIGSNCVQLKRAKKLNHRKKIKRKEKKIQTLIKKSNIFDIDNFVIQNNARCIHQKHLHLDIPIPVFKEIDTNSYNPILKSFDQEENISDEVYLSYHQIYENREKDYKLSFFKKKKVSEKTDQTFTVISLSDNITSKSNEDVHQNLKFRINYDQMSNAKVTI